MVGHDDFFNKLLGETYSLIERETPLGPTEKLSDYFDKRYETSNLHNAIRIIGHRSDLKVFRMNINDRWIDFPDNWSLFAKIKHHMALQTSTKIIVDQNHPDMLCKILNVPQGHSLKFELKKGHLSLVILKAEESSSAA